MKSKVMKVFFILVIAIIILNISTVSNAVTYPFTFTVDPTEKTAEVGDTVTINLGIADIDQSTDGINAIQGDLLYDESIFENVEIITTQSNWSVTFNQLNESDRKGRFVISNLTGTKLTQDVAQLNVTIKSGTTASSGIVKLNNVFSSYGTTDTEKTNKTITIMINQNNTTKTRK